MRKKHSSIIFFLCLALMVSCATKPTPILIQEPPTVASNPEITATSILSIPTLSATSAPLIQPSTSSNTPQSGKPPSVQEPAWTFTTGAPIWGPITVSDRIIFFGSDDGFIYAVDSQSHALKWKYQTGAAVRSRPAISNHQVYFISDNSFVYALSFDQGNLVWKTQIGDPIPKRNSQFNLKDFILATLDVFTSSPTIQDNTIYVGSTDDNLYALDATNGHVNWKFHAQTSIEGIRQTPIVANGMVYFGDMFTSFYAIDIKTGSPVWTYPIGNNEIFSSQATLVGQTIFLSTVTSIVALDAITGKEVWNSPCYPGLKIPAYAGGILYADGCQDNQYYPLAAYEATTGKILWVTNAPNANFFSVSSPAVGKNNVYFGASGAGLFAVDKQTGAIQWMIPVRSGKDDVGVISSAAVADGMVYFGGMDGNLYAAADQ